jgi:hypothetical protein
MTSCDCVGVKNRKAMNCINLRVEELDTRVQSTPRDADELSGQKNKKKEDDFLRIEVQRDQNLP